MGSGGLLVLRWGWAERTSILKVSAALRWPAFRTQPVWPMAEGPPASSDPATGPFLPQPHIRVSAFFLSELSHFDK